MDEFLVKTWNVYDHGKIVGHVVGRDVLEAEIEAKRIYGYGWQEVFVLPRFSY
jgi:hypothetical protein